MTLGEFLERMGLSDRTLRYWHERGLVPKPSLKEGVGYTDDHELRVFAIFELQKQGIRGIDELKARLGAMTNDEMRLLVDGEAVPEEEHDTQPPREPPTGPMNASLEATGPSLVPEGRSQAERHLHVPLRPGLLLDIRLPLDDETQALVRSIGVLAGLNLSFLTKD
jgi:Ca-activated chloride channel family protein